MGHRLKQINSYGNMKALWWDFQSGSVTSTSDRRGEGKASHFKTKKVATL